MTSLLLLWSRDKPVFITHKQYAILIRTSASQVSHTHVLTPHHLHLQCLHSNCNLKFNWFGKTFHVASQCCSLNNICDDSLFILGMHDPLSSVPILMPRLLVSANTEYQSDTRALFCRLLLVLLFFYSNQCCCWHYVQVYMTYM